MSEFFGELLGIGLSDLLLVVFLEIARISFAGEFRFEAGLQFLLQQRLPVHGFEPIVSFDVLGAVLQDTKSVLTTKKKK